MKDAGQATIDALKTLSPKRLRNSRDHESPSGSKSERASRRSRRPRSRTQPPAELPPLELSEEDFLKEWGITKDQEEIKLKEFREMLEKEVGSLKPIFDKYFLRRFLRARQHDLRRASDMFKAHLKWREDFGTDTILDDFHFAERDAFLTLYPQGYHKTDKLGRPVYIQHLGQINVKALMEVTTDERMLRFHVQEYERALKYIFPSCSLIAGQHVSQTLAIMDVKGVGLRHLTGEVKRILGMITRTDQDNYPETLGKTLIINAPVVFRGVWAVVKPMLDPRTQAKIEMCPSDYMKVLTRWVDIENIPQYLGGNSKGSLLDDVGPWNDPALTAEIDRQWEKRMMRGVDHAVSPSMEWDLDSPSPLASHPRVSIPGSLSMVDELGGEDGAVISPFAKTKGGKEEHGDKNGEEDVGEYHADRTRRKKALLESDGDVIERKDTASSIGQKHSIREDTEQGTPTQSNEYGDAMPAALSTKRKSSTASSIMSAAFYSANEEGYFSSASDGMESTSSWYVNHRSQQHGSGTILPSPGGATPSSRPAPLVVSDPAGATPSPRQYSDTDSATAAAARRQSEASMQISILGRIRAIEERLPDMEKSLKKRLPSNKPLPSRSTGQGTLLMRVATLEKAMDLLLQAQSEIINERSASGGQSKGGTSQRCCAVM